MTLSDREKYVLFYHSIVLRTNMSMEVKQDMLMQHIRYLTPTISAADSFELEMDISEFFKEIIEFMDSAEEKHQKDRLISK